MKQSFLLLQLGLVGAAVVLLLVVILFQPPMSEEETRLDNLLAAQNDGPTGEGDPAPDASEAGDGSATEGSRNAVQASEPDSAGDAEADAPGKGDRHDAAPLPAGLLAPGIPVPAAAPGKAKPKASGASKPSTKASAHKSGSNAKKHARKSVGGKAAPPPPPDVAPLDAPDAGVETGY